MRILAILILALAATGCGSSRTGGDATGDEVRELTHAERGPVEVDVLQRPAAPTLVDLVEIEIRVRHAEGVSITPPPFGQLFAGDRLLVRDYREREPRLLDDGRFETSYVYSLEPAWSGATELPPVAIDFEDRRPGSESGAEPHRLETESFTVEIGEIPSDRAPTLADLRPAAPAVPLPAPPLSTAVVVLSVLSLVLVAMILLLLLRRDRVAQRPEPRIPPRLLARSEIDQLLRKELIEKGRIQEFYYELTGIVRRFLEREHGLHAPRRSTEEFLVELSRSKALAPALAGALAAFLESADLVKYAAQIPTREVASASVDRAREIIDQSAREEHPGDAPLTGTRQPAAEVAL